MQQGQHDHHTFIVVFTIDYCFYEHVIILTVWILVIVNSRCQYSFLLSCFKGNCYDSIQISCLADKLDYLHLHQYCFIDNWHHHHHLQINREGCCLFSFFNVGCYHEFVWLVRNLHVRLLMLCVVEVIVVCCRVFAVRLKPIYKYLLDHNPQLVLLQPLSLLAQQFFPRQNYLPLLQQTH